MTTQRQRILIQLSSPAFRIRWDLTLSVQFLFSAQRSLSVYRSGNLMGTLSNGKDRSSPKLAKTLIIRLEITLGAKQWTQPCIHLGVHQLGSTSGWKNKSDNFILRFFFWYDILHISQNFDIDQSNFLWDFHSTSLFLRCVSEWKNKVTNHIEFFWTAEN